MPEPKRRKKLNDEQIEVLKLLYKFRFGSNNLIAQYFGKKDRSFVFKRLSILLEQGLIGKRFDSSYRIQGRPAAYYLLPAGARVLQEKSDEEINIKSIYKDKTVSETFISHCLDILAVYIQLKLQYGNKLKFFTKSQLVSFDYFPSPLPDAYLRLKTEGVEKQFFLDIYHDNQPFFKVVRNIKKYVEYAESGEWETTESDLPAVLAVCDSGALYKRLQKQMLKAKHAWEEPVFAATTKANLNAGQSSIWRFADEPDEELTLESIQ
jgi:hypothetical protein